MNCVVPSRVVHNGISGGRDVERPAEISGREMPLNVTTTANRGEAVLR